AHASRVCRDLPLLYPLADPCGPDIHPSHPKRSRSWPQNTTACIHSGSVVPPRHDLSNRINHTPLLSASVGTSISHSRLSAAHAAPLPHRDKFPPWQPATKGDVLGVSFHPQCCAPPPARV